MTCLPTWALVSVALAFAACAVIALAVLADRDGKRK